jgi:hypothetical protein
MWFDGISGGISVIRLKSDLSQFFHRGSVAAFHSFFRHLLNKERLFRLNYTNVCSKRVSRALWITVISLDVGRDGLKS